MTSPPNGSTIRAAGGVVWRASSDDASEPTIEVALVHRPRYGDWSFPKGKLAAGESEVDGGIREVLEETGYHVRLGRPLGETRYMKEQNGYQRPKVVRWWAMEATAGAFAPTREVDELRWLTLSEAHDQLSRLEDRDLLERFVRGPAPTRVVLLVRHASAGSRATWQGDDRERPLDDCGRLQADELVRLLAHFDPGLIASADFVRCVQSVEPLAAALGLPIRELPELSELNYRDHEEDAVQMVRGLGGPHETVVICSQGEVIPDLLRRLASDDDVDLPSPLVTKKAGTWALTFRQDRLAGGESFPPPSVDCSGSGQAA